MRDLLQDRASLCPDAPCHGAVPALPGVARLPPCLRASLSTRAPQ